MKPEYAAWIEAFNAEFPKDTNGQPAVRGACGRAARQMILSFPELRRVPGTVFMPIGMSHHWWCETPEGEIVDPTVAQFHPWIAFLDYCEWPKEEPLPIGKCMNCGDLVYEGARDRAACSEECYAELCQSLR